MKNYAIIHQSGNRLFQKDKDRLEDKAKTQTEKIKEFFSKDSGSYTARDIHWIVFKDRGELNSVRRAMTDLAHEKNGCFLEKVEDDRKKEHTGVHVCKWRRARHEGQIRFDF